MELLRPRFLYHAHKNSLLLEGKQGHRIQISKSNSLGDPIIEIVKGNVLGRNTPISVQIHTPWYDARESAKEADK